MTKIDTKDWKPYRIDALFTRLEMKCRKPDFKKALDVSDEPTDEFSLPLVNARHFNNGIMYYGRPADFDSEEMTIDIVQNGAIATGDVYAQPQRTGVLWDAYLIKPKDEIRSTAALFFLATCLEKAIKDRFGYNDKCVWEKVRKLSVTLPAAKDGAPDYGYMAAYIDKLQKRVRQSVELLLAVI